MIQGYLTNLEFAEEFFERCESLNPDTRETRTALWEQMVKELKGIRMNEKDVERYSRNKKVLKITKSKETHEPT